MKEAVLLVVRIHNKRNRLRRRHCKWPTKSRNILLSTLRAKFATMDGGHANDRGWPCLFGTRRTRFDPTVSSLVFPPPSAKGERSLRNSWLKLYVRDLHLALGGKRHEVNSEELNLLSKDRDPGTVARKPVRPSATVLSPSPPPVFPRSPSYSRKIERIPAPARPNARLTLIMTPVSVSRDQEKFVGRARLSGRTGNDKSINARKAQPDRRGHTLNPASKYFRSPSNPSLAADDSITIIHAINGGSATRILPQNSRVSRPCGPAVGRPPKYIRVRYARSSSFDLGKKTLYGSKFLNGTVCVRGECRHSRNSVRR